MRVEKIIEVVRTTGEWTGKLNYNEISEVQEAGLYNMALEGGVYRVVDNPNKF